MTLAELLQSVAAERPTKGITYLGNDGSESRQTYVELLASAKRLLGALQKAGLQPGDYVIAQVATSQSQIEVFWASLLGGMVPVLLPQVVAWGRASENRRKLVEVWKICGRPLVVIESRQAETYAGLSADVLPGVNYLAIESAVADAMQLPALHSGRPEDLAFLQFSSGSTGLPKGVCLTHANLVCNIQDMIATARFTPQDVYLSWMPYFHDMGLIGMHLIPLFLGADQYKLDASTFVANPLRWLQEIHARRATIATSPNFGLQLVLDRLSAADVATLDLSCLRLLFNGAEPIFADTMRRFSELAAHAGFAARAMFPVYGMAEACLGVTFGPIGEQPVVHAIDREDFFRDGKISMPRAGSASIEYVDVGYPLPSMQVRIRDELGRIHQDRGLGEIQIFGPNVTAGYLGNADANREVFTEDGWLRTGDIGFFVDGRLVIVGRAKEVVFVNGRNIMAYDIERAAQELCGLKSGSVAACGITDERSNCERVAVFVAMRRNADPARLHAIKTRLQDYFGFRFDYVIPLLSIPRTSSGKLQRLKLAAELKSGAHENEIAVLREFEDELRKAAVKAQPTDGREAAIHQAWCEVLGLQPVELGVDDSFGSVGGTSVKAVQLLARIEEVLCCTLSFDLLIECKTVRQMARFIEANGASVRGDAAAAPQADGRDPGGRPRIAIIGLALRFPGAVNADEYWQTLVAGRSQVTEVPSDRWSVPGRRFHMAALDGVDAFDAEFFGISPAEAVVMDPQQRLALEVAYESLENAGYAGTRLDAGRNVGVYLGVTQNGYGERVIARLQSEHADDVKTPYTIAGNLVNMVAARITHCLNLKGPAMTFDAACASSLVAIHAACHDLAAGNCDIALAGGINLLLTPTVHQLFEQVGALSPDGVCRSFDERANGTVLGEGIGMIVLKPLDAALRDGDRIEGVIESIGVNNDGRSIGIMAPNPEGQERLLRSVYGRTGISPSRVGYIETHGTGTPVGDPVEIRSLSRVFTPAPDRKPYCAVGSVKPNIGHLLGAAGIAGVIKVLLAMRYGKIPPSINLDKPHPNIGFERTALYPVTELIDWPAPGKTRYAGISAFGFGGTNAHIVLSHWHTVRQPELQAEPVPHLLCLSARSEQSLLAAGRRLAGYLRRDPVPTLTDLCLSQNLGRQAFPYRQPFVARTAAELAIALDTFADTQQSATRCARARDLKIAFVFGGMGSEDAGLAGTLYRRFAAFRHSVDSCCQAAGPHLPHANELKRLIIEPQATELPADQRHAYAAAFIVQYALSSFWISLGVRPVAVLCHDLGDYVAACIAGVMTFEDALRLVAMRALAPDAFAREFESVAFGVPTIPVISASTGLSVSDAMRDSRYWLGQPCGEFTTNEALGALRRLGVRCALEVGVGDVLTAAALTVPEEDRIVVLRLLTGNLGAQSVDAALLEAAGALWRIGCELDLAALNPSAGAALLPLPGYPFERSSFWLPTREVPALPAASEDSRRDAAGVALPDWFYRPLWQPEDTVADAPHFTPGSNWLLFDLGSDAGAEFERRLELHGSKVTRVAAGAEFRADGKAGYTINPNHADDYVRVLASLAESGAAVDGICYLWSLVPHLDADDLAGALDSQLRTAIDPLFRLTRALQQSQLARHIRLCVATGNVQHVPGYACRLNPVGGAIWGLLKSLRLEAGQLEISCLDFDLGAESGASMVDALFAELANATGGREAFAVYRRGKRFVERIARVDIESAVLRPSLLKRRGVYLIPGGLGGIGLKLAAWLTDRLDAEVILLTRRSLPPASEWERYRDAHPASDPVRQCLDKLQPLLRGRTHVISADICKKDDVRGLTAEIAVRFGRLDGVIHCAGVLRDRLVKGMTDDDWSSVLEPKVRGIALLYQHLKDLTPSVHVFFSSLINVYGNVGQANHAAANCFEDAFARYLRQQGEQVLTINWGFWSEVGVVADPFYKRLLARKQVYPMTTELALSAFEAATQLPYPQQIIANIGEGVCAAINQTTPAAALARRAERLRLEPVFVAELDKYASVHQRVNALCGQLVFDALFSRQAADDDASFSLDELIARFGVRTRYQKLLRRLLDILLEDRLLARSGKRYSINRAAATIDAAAEAAALAAEFPPIATPIGVLTRCLRALRSVLDGSQLALSLLFPRGSLDELEQIYEKFPMLRLGNLMLADALGQLVDDAPRDKFEILEVGAGTGGLSSEVIPRVCRDGVTYLYTDLSAIFLNHAKQKFSGYQSFETGILDICRDPAAQGFGGRAFDAVICANVLHATPDLRRTLANIHGLLRPGGYLLTVETTRPSRYADCTVGLLDGWWSFTDSDLRADHALLASSQWQALLREMGFSVAVVDVGGPGRGARSEFSLIVAQSPCESSATGHAPAKPASYASGTVMAMARNSSGEVSSAASASGGSPEVVEALGRLFRRVLAIDDLAPDTNFFELRVHSLRATQIISALRDIFEVEVPITAFFEAPSIVQMTELIIELGKEAGRDVQTIAEVFNEVESMSDDEVVAHADECVATQDMA